MASLARHKLSMLAHQMLTRNQFVAGQFAEAKDARCVFHEMR